MLDKESFMRTEDVNNKGAAKTMVAQSNITGSHVSLDKADAHMASVWKDKVKVENKTDDNTIVISDQNYSKVSSKVSIFKKTSKID